MVGIVGYGTYLPKYRIKAEEIARVWNDDGARMSKGLGIIEKTVPCIDEDTVTISVAAARNALSHAGIDPADIGAIYVGSESHPYAVKPTATIVAAAIEAQPHLTAADYEFACKAGTAAIQTCMGLVAGGYVKYGLAIGADTSQGKPGDALEYSASAGGAAFIIGEKNTVADIEDTYSYTTDTPDFWRREGEDFPRHGSRFTGEPAYFKHVSAAATGMMERHKLKPGDFDYVVFHQPNGKFPRRIGKMLGFEKEQIEPGMVVPTVGNTYSGATPLGIAKTLDEAKKGERILAVSYGSGAGSDAFIINVKKENEKRRNPTPLQRYLDDKIYIDYAVYAKYKSKLKGVALDK